MFGVSVIRAEKQQQEVLTTLSQTISSGYVDTSAIWTPGWLAGPQLSISGSAGVFALSWWLPDEADYMIEFTASPGKAEWTPLVSTRACPFPAITLFDSENRFFRLRKVEPQLLILTEVP